MNEFIWMEASTDIRHGHGSQNTDTVHTLIQSLFYVIVKGRGSFDVIRQRRFTFLRATANCEQFDVSIRSSGFVSF